MKIWSYFNSLVLLTLVKCVELEAKFALRVSDPYDMGGPWPFNKPMDINILDIPTGNIPTVSHLLIC